MFLVVLFGFSASAFADLYYVAQNGDSLSISEDGTAALDSSCGGGTIREFSANGPPMTEIKFGGLPGVQPRSVTVTATSRGHNIVLAEGHIKTVYRWSPVKPEPHVIRCL